MSAVASKAAFMSQSPATKKSNDKVVGKNEESTRRNKRGKRGRKEFDMSQMLERAKRLCGL